jgi:hypothetical protein
MGCCAWRPAGFDYTIFCIPWTAVQQPAPACSRAAARGKLAGSDTTILCIRWAAVRQQAPAGCWAAACGGLAGSDYPIFCTLRAVRQPAPASCRAAARWGSQAPTTPSSAPCWPQSGSRLQSVVGLLLLGGSPAPTTPPAALYWPPSGSRHRLVAGLRRAGGSPASTKPSLALCWLPSCRRILLVAAGLQCVGGSPASTTPSAALCSAWGPAGFDDNIFCTLRTAVRQPVSACCRAAARWGFLLRRHHVLSSECEVGGQMCRAYAPTGGPPA